MEPQLRLDLCWHLVALLELRGHQVHSPASSSLPWDVVAGADDRIVVFQLLDDKPARISLRPPTIVTDDDISRVGLTLLWAGREALFGDQNDYPVTAKLAARIAAWCPSITEAGVRSLYTARCDAVHGRTLTAQAAQQAMTDTERLLLDSMVQAIERNQVPPSDW